MPQYTVKPGDTLLGLAAANGLKSHQEILDAPENSSLTVEDPGVLLAGMSLFIPSRELRQEPSAVDAKHTFKVARPKAWIRVAVKDAAGVALEGKKYQLTIDGKQTNGTVPAGGIIEQAVAVDAKDGRLTVWLSDRESDTEIWNLRLGYMDPLDAVSGVQARLNNLGFDCGDPDGVLDDDTKAAIKAFQARVGIEQTGAIDDALKQKLASYYDPVQDEATQDATESSS